MERYKEELFINETSHSFLSPPCSPSPFAKWVASHGLIQCSYYFKKDYVFLLFETERAASLTICQTIRQRGTLKEMSLV